MVGLEVELFTINEEGAMVNGANDILNAVKGTKLEKYVAPELSQSMIELRSKEKRTIRECALAFLDNLQLLTELSEKLGYRLLPLGTHPGSMQPTMNTKAWYDAKNQVLGDDTIKEARISGFHFHYTLPEGILEKNTERIKNVGRSKARDIFLQQYNLLVALDPAALTFCQSSPIWMGVNLAKDSRVLIYRDMEVLKGGTSTRGIHYYLPMFGALPEYEFTLQDIRVMADQKKTEWLRLLEQKKFPTNEIAGYPSLKFMWGPLRVNKVGTFEYRGLDMNYPEVIFSTASLIFFALQAIEKLDLEAFPSDVGINEPFALEDNLIYLPPHATLKYLEYQSVLRGFESPEINKYCSNLINLVGKISEKSDSRNLALIKNMLASKKSVSDDILSMVKKNGYSLEQKIPEEMLNHIALYSSDRFSKSFSSLKTLFSSFTD